MNRDFSFSVCGCGWTAAASDWCGGDESWGHCLAAARWKSNPVWLIQDAVAGVPATSTDCGTLSQPRLGFHSPVFDLHRIITPPLSLAAPRGVESSSAQLHGESSSWNRIRRSRITVSRGWANVLWGTLWEWIGERYCIILLSSSIRVSISVYKSDCPLEFEAVKFRLVFQTLYGFSILA